jgi:hypothetical protein
LHLRTSASPDDKLLKMSPQQAARIILAGVQANRSRVLVGKDPKAVDALVRLAPRYYSTIVTWWDKRNFGEP